MRVINFCAIIMTKHNYIHTYQTHTHTLTTAEAIGAIGTLEGGLGVV